MAKSVIWITGAGKGIGRALALELSARGNTIAASARTAEDLATLAAEAGTQGGPIHAYPLDVTDGEAVAQIAAGSRASSGRPTWWCSMPARMPRRARRGSILARFAGSSKQMSWAPPIACRRFCPA